MLIRVSAGVSTGDVGGHRDEAHAGWTGPVIVRVFTAAGVLWLLILLALGSLDPLTRVVYPVEPLR